MSKIERDWGHSHRNIPANFDYQLVVNAARDTDGILITYLKTDDTYHHYRVDYDSIHALGLFSEKLGIQIGMHIMVQSYEHRQVS